MFATNNTYTQKLRYETGLVQTCAQRLRYYITVVWIEKEIGY